MKWFHMSALALVASVLVACSGSGPPTEAPISAAGEDFAIKVGEQPRFDACASSGDIINYRWTIVTAPQSMQEDTGKVIRETEPNCAFTLEAQMGVDEVGTWRIQLEVTDAAGNRATDTVTVTVNE